MDIFLDDNTSLMLTRMAATNRSIALSPTSVSRPTALDLHPVKLGRLEIPGLLSCLRVPEDRKLGILVPHRDNRIRSKGIACSVKSSPRGDNPFLLLCSANQLQPSPIVPENTRVFVLNPCNIVLGMAHRLLRRIRNGTMTRTQATLMIAKLCLELCGTYSHDAFDPHCGTVTYSVEPRMSKKELCEFLEIPGRDQGLRLAREAAQLVYNLSGSPQESFLGPALFANSQLGGLELCDFKANEQLDLSAAEHASIDYRTITPDFQLVGYNAVVEYKGEVHNEGDNPRIDHKRSLDYQTLGKREFSLWYDDVKTQNRFMETASRIVSVLESYDGPRVRERFLKMTKSPSFRKRQKTLFEVFMPWLRNTDKDMPAS